MRVLICTDGSPAAEAAASFVSRLSFPPDTQLILLGVSETDGDQVYLTKSFDRIEHTLDGISLSIQRKIDYGNAAEIIHKETEENRYDLVVLGERGHPRGFVGWKIGSTVNKLARTLTIPFLVARNVPLRLSKILLCTGGETASLETVRVAGRLVSSIETEIILLHVMSQVAMSIDSQSDDLLDTAQSAIQRGTREGQHLKQALQLLSQVVVTAPITPCLRHGLVVDEVLAELEEGNYDLLAIGGHYHHGRSHWEEFLLEDVAGRLIQRAPCSVLIV
jgi:nucleotide-binding universal stress UspA family protein